VISSSANLVSFGIDKVDMKALPLFLVKLGKLKSVKEWLISPSSMDEVFMRIVEINRDVENADKIVEIAAIQEKNRKEVHLCKICGINLAEPGRFFIQHFPSLLFFIQHFPPLLSFHFSFRNEH